MVKPYRVHTIQIMNFLTKRNREDQQNILIHVVGEYTRQYVHTAVLVPPHYDASRELVDLHTS